MLLSTAGASTDRREEITPRPPRLPQNAGMPGQPSPVQACSQGLCRGPSQPAGRRGRQAGAELTLQVDGLTLVHAVVALVEAACLVGRRYLLGGSNYHPELGGGEEQI